MDHVYLFIEIITIWQNLTSSGPAIIGKKPFESKGWFCLQVNSCVALMPCLHDTRACYLKPSFTFIKVEDALFSYKESHFAKEWQKVL